MSRGIGRSGTATGFPPKRTAVPVQLLPWTADRRRVRYARATLFGRA